MAIITHAEIAAFAADKVNLRKEDADEYRAQVRTLREKLTAYISEHPSYSLVKMLHSGSVAKGTALSTINDMDVAIYVKQTEAPSDERQLIDWMVERLKEAYGALIKDHQVKPSKHCATIQFVGTGLSVDVVPVLYEGGEDDRGYLIVKDTGNRVLTSVKLHKEFIRARKMKSGNYAQVVRLIKWWAKRQKESNEQFRMKSFIVELLCAHLLRNGIIDTDYFTYLEQFFTYIVKSGLRERIAFSDYYPESQLSRTPHGAIEIYDPVNPANNVAASYSDADRAVICNTAHEALDCLTEARYAPTKSQSLDLMRQIFGPGFRC